MIYKRRSPVRRKCVKRQILFESLEDRRLLDAAGATPGDR